MKKMMILAVLMMAAGCTVLDSLGLETLLGGAPLNEGTIGAGLKDALRVGTANAIDSLSTPGGYSKSEFRIGWPATIEKLTSTLKAIGLGSQVELIEKRMNLAAEQAAAKAMPVFMDSVKGMTFADVNEIWQGGDTAATDYFRKKTMPKLVKLYSPIVQKQMSSLGVVSEFSSLLERYHAIPLVPRIEFSPESYVTEKALAGLFSQLALEEKKIRTNPAAQTTALLRRVFGSQ